MIKNRIFISFSEKDNKMALKLIEFLGSDNIQYWYYKENSAGQSIVQNIEKEIDKAQYAILIFSDNYLNSRFCMKEYGAILKRSMDTGNPIIIPIINGMSPDRLPTLIGDKQAVVIDYELTYQNYKEIIKPIMNTEYSQLLKEYQGQFYDKINSIETILKKKKIISEDIEYINKLIDDSSLSKYFLNNKSVRNEKWFTILNSLGLFESSKIPIYNKSIPQYWNIYPYLYMLSKDDNKSDKLELELIRLMTSHLKYIKEKQIADQINLHTYNYITEIISNCSAKNIDKFVKDNGIQILHEWLEILLSNTINNDLVGTIIINKLWPQIVEIENDEYINIIITGITVYYEKQQIVANKVKIAQLKIDGYFLTKFHKDNIDIIAKFINENTMKYILKQLKRVLELDNNRRTEQIEIGDQLLALNAIKKENQYDIYYSYTKNTVSNQLNSILYEDEITDIEYEEFVRIEANNEDEFNKGFEELIKSNEILNKEKEHISEDHISRLYKAFNEDYSTIWYQNIRRPIDDEGMNQGARYYLVAIINFTLENLVRNNNQLALMIVKNMLNGEYEYPIFIRIALNIVSQNWELYRDEFIGFLEHNLDCFQNYNYEVELMRIISENKEKFNGKEERAIKFLIKKGPRYIPEQANKTEYVNNWKKKWFSDNTQYYKLIENSGFARIDEGESPIKSEYMIEIVKTEYQKLTKILNDEIRKNTTNGEKYYLNIHINALENEFREAIASVPEKFIDHIEEFTNLEYPLLNAFIRGLIEYVKNKENIRFGKIIKFINTIISTIIRNTDDIVENAKKYQGKDYSPHDIWLFNSIFDLFEQITRKDKNMPIKHIKEVFRNEKEILQIMNNIHLKYEVKYEVTHRDHYTEAINTNYGRGIIAYINIVLHARRNNRRIYWKRIYSDLLKKPIIEAYTLFGRYIRNYYFIDESYMKKTLNNILQRGGMELQAFIEGYLSEGGVYKELYELTYKHIKKIVNIGFSNEIYHERLAQYLTVGYLRGYEDVRGNNNYENLINLYQFKYLNAISNFMKQTLKYAVNNPDKTNPAETQLFKKRIRDYWRWFYKKRNEIKKQLSKEDFNKVRTAMALLIISFDGLGEEEQQWIETVKESIYQFELYEFIGYLTQFDKEDDLKYISSLIEYYIEHGYFNNLNLNENDIIVIFNNLIKNDMTYQLNYLINKLGEKGFYKFRDLYKEE